MYSFYFVIFMFNSHFTGLHTIDFCNEHHARSRWTFRRLNFDRIAYIVRRPIHLRTR